MGRIWQGDLKNQKFQDNEIEPLMVDKSTLSQVQVSFGCMPNARNDYFSNEL